MKKYSISYMVALVDSVSIEVEAESLLKAIQFTTIAIWNKHRYLPTSVIYHAWDKQTNASCVDYELKAALKLSEAQLMRSI